MKKNSEELGLLIKEKIQTIDRGGILIFFRCKSILETIKGYWEKKKYFENYKKFNENNFKGNETEKF